MKLHLDYFAQLRDLAGKAHEERETSLTSLGALYEALREEYHFPFQPEHLRVAVNDAFASWDDALTEGDRIVFIPPVTGG